MFCPKCGCSNGDGDRYCRQCGRKLDKKQANKGWIAVVAVLCVVIAVLLSSPDGKTEEKNAPETRAANTAVQSANHSTEAAQAQDTGNSLDYVGGTWESVNIHDGNSTLSTYALVFDQTLRQCQRMTVNMDVEMNANTKCREWQLWGRVGGKFKKLERISLPAGNGETSQTVVFSTPVTMDAIVVTPTVLGGYSWFMSLYLTDVKTA